MYLLERKIRRICLKIVFKNIFLFFEIKNYYKTDLIIKNCFKKIKHFEIIFFKLFLLIF